MGNSDKDSKSLGAELNKARLEKGLSLDGISHKTKINVKYLEAIENDRFDFLYEPYILVFIKAYAKALGFNPEEFKDKYYKQIHSQLDTAQKEVQHTRNVQEEHIKQPYAVPSVNLNEIWKVIKHYQKPIVLLLAMVLCLVVILFLQRLFSEPEKDIIVPIPQEVPEQIETFPVISDTVQQNPLNLRLFTRDTLWIRVIIDDSDTIGSLFLPGGSHSWEAENKFEILAGKSTGFDLFFNEEPVQNLIYNERPLRNIFNERVMIGKLVLTKDGVVELRAPNR
ncbi:hypothetical protein AMJ80_12205 [bacterium SM23_31]|nr:MAG: hypothetical protein AMJ80_12205 [bacterium SM23_31]